MDIPASRNHRRLSALFTTTSGTGERLNQLALTQIVRNCDQPRTKFDVAAIEALAQSLREQGIIQPIVVRPLPDERFEIVAGERRWLAAQRAGLSTIPAIIRDRTDQATLLASLAENIVREDLNAFDTARAYATLVDEWNMSIAAIAKAVGKSRPTVSNTLRLLELPDEILECLQRGTISEGHARCLLQLTNRVDQRRMCRRCIDESLSVRALERMIRSFLEQRPPSEPRSKRFVEVEGALSCVSEAIGNVTMRGTGNETAGSLEFKWRSKEEFNYFVRQLREVFEGSPQVH